MSRRTSEQHRFLEISLIVICVGLCCLLYRVGNYRMVVLNLFYLPIGLSAFFLGRYRAGVLAVLCMVSVTIVIALNLNAATSFTPLATGLALTIWGAVLGINAILVGTLSDERARRIDDLHDAYLGVVEVLVQYLNSADPMLKDRATKVSDLCQQVATRMRLSQTEIDNIRVAALLQDVESVEVTARVIRKAVGNLAHGERTGGLEHTFSGSDLVQSLGSVLTGALPLLVDHGDYLNVAEDDDDAQVPAEPAMGAAILRTVRRYYTLLSRGSAMTPRHAVSALKSDIECDHHPAVIYALEQTVFHAPKAQVEEEQTELVGVD